MRGVNYCETHAMEDEMDTWRWGLDSTRKAREKVMIARLKKILITESASGILMSAPCRTRNAMADKFARIHA